MQERLRRRTLGNFRRGISDGNVGKVSVFREFQEQSVISVLFLIEFMDMQARSRRRTVGNFRRGISDGNMGWGKGEGF